MGSRRSFGLGHVSSACDDVSISESFPLEAAVVVDLPTVLRKELPLAWVLFDMMSTSAEGRRSAGGSKRHVCGTELKV